MKPATKNPVQRAGAERGLGGGRPFCRAHFERSSFRQEVGSRDDPLTTLLRPKSPAGGEPADPVSLASSEDQTFPEAICQHDFQF
jgi:hypothetical protein